MVTATSVVVPAARLIEAVTFLRDTPGCQFDYLSDLTAVDWPTRDKRFDVVLCLGLLYHVVRPFELFELLQALFERLKLAVDRIAPLHGTVRLEYHWRGWRSGLEVELVDRQSKVADYNGELPTPGYALLHLRAGYTFREP